jgi:hypothetical protein
MAQSIENWARICGGVIGVRSSADRPNWLVVELVVDSIGDVEGYRNLLRSQLGPTTLEVPARAARAARVRVGARLCCRAARRTPTLIIAHPDHVQCQ